jgi:AcrR family transcriptional regulator
VYRYFPSAEGLLLAAASDGVTSFLDDIAALISDLDDPTEVVSQGIAFTVEEIERRVEVALVLAPSRGLSSRELTSMYAVDVGRSLLLGSRVDWRAAGYESDDALDGLVRHMLRTLESFVVDPGRPPLRGDELRAYLTRWIGPAVVQRSPTATTARRD